MTVRNMAVSNKPTRRIATPVALGFAISCFFIWGLAYGLLDVLNKHFQETLHVGKAQSSWLQIAYFGAYLIMSLPAGSIMHARGYKFGIVTGLAITAIGALLFIPAAVIGSFYVFVGCMFILATGLCFLETAADTYVNELGHPDRATGRLNLAQSFNALGVFFGPLIGGLVFFGPASGSQSQQAVQITYAIIGIAVLVYAFVLARLPLPEVHEGDHISSVDVITFPVKPLWRHGHFVWGVFTQMVYIGAQVGIGAYFINLVTDVWPGLTSQKGAFLLSIATVGYLIGRFVSTALLIKVPPRALLTAYGVINMVLTLIVAAGIQRLSAICLIAVFFFMSAMFATIFTLGVKGLGTSTKRASSIMVMAIGGGVLLPYPMGRLAELWGTPAAFVLPAACFALVALYGLWGARTKV